MLFVRTTIKILIPCLLAAVAAVFPSLQARGEPTGFAALRTETVTVYLDCKNAWCDFSYIRREITFVNYVRDPENADVHVLVTSTQTGSGGQRYTIALMGRGAFSERTESLRFTTNSDDTPDQIREKLVQHLKLGLIPYVADTALAQRLTIGFEGDRENVAPPPADDPWNFWVFDVDFGGWFNKESQRSSYDVDASASANRVTENWRIRNNLRYQYEMDRFEHQGTEVKSTAREMHYNSSAVKSLTDHWSAGLFGRYDSDTETNLANRFAIAPAVEFNIFPYSETERRELTLAYLVRGSAVEYQKETIFNRTSELLSEHALNLRLRLTQPWGEARVFMEGSHYFHDASKYSIDLWSLLSVRVARGLSIRAQVAAERVMDQLYLPKGDASLEEILLQRRQLATNYELSGSLGLSYTFGSIYNSIVNERL